MQQMILKPIALLSFALLFGGLSACYMPPEFIPLEKYASGNPESKEQAILELRELGPRGLSTFVNRFGTVMESGTPEAKAEFTAALDRIAGQKDAWFAQLYWFTDLEKAKAAARAEHKPILSLRMLGQLTDNLSCANSRMFRTFLYPDEELSAYLKEHYVLHWSSERAVPRVSIDFGDGRKLETTVTGNSIHYVLDQEGNPLQGIPGVYSPEVFMNKLIAAEKLFFELEAAEPMERASLLAAFHQKEFDRIGKQAGSVGLEVEAPGRMDVMTAGMAERLTVGKAMVERPVLDQVAMEPMKRANPWDGIEREEAAERAQWSEAARAFGFTSRIGSRATQLMQRLRESGEPQGLGFFSEVNRYRENLRLESAKNEVMVQAHIHRWFAEQDESSTTFAALNTRVYAELFITPRSDEWLGMLPAGVYTGLDNGGVIRE